MPTISQFFGIVIQMFWREHAPPHFHALYGEYEALIDIRTLEVLGGKLPKRALALTIEWAAEQRSKLMEDLNLCQASNNPRKFHHWSKPHGAMAREGAHDSPRTPTVGKLSGRHIGNR
jgi:hypothetical protein